MLDFAHDRENDSAAAAPEAAQRGEMHRKVQPGALGKPTLQTVVGDIAAWAEETKPPRRKSARPRGTPLPSRAKQSKISAMSQELGDMGSLFEETARRLR